MNCSDCRFFKSREAGKWGSCRRYPPMNPDGMWPGVSADAWCGEHQYRTPVQLPSVRSLEPAPDLGHTVNEGQQTIDAAWHGAEWMPLPPVEAAASALGAVLDDMRSGLKPADLPPVKGKKS